MPLSLACIEDVCQSREIHYVSSSEHVGSVCSGRHPWEEQAVTLHPTAVPKCLRARPPEVRQESWAGEAPAGVCFQFVCDSVTHVALQTLRPGCHGGLLDCPGVANNTGQVDWSHTAPWSRCPPTAAHPMIYRQVGTISWPGAALLSIAGHVAARSLTHVTRSFPYLVVIQRVKAWILKKVPPLHSMCNRKQSLGSDFSPPV